MEVQLPLQFMEWQLYLLFFDNAQECVCRYIVSAGAASLGRPSVTGTFTLSGLLSYFPLRPILFLLFMYLQLLVLFLYLDL